MLVLRSKVEVRSAKCELLTSMCVAPSPLGASVSSGSASFQISYICFHDLKVPQLLLHHCYSQFWTIYCHPHQPTYANAILNAILECGRTVLQALQSMGSSKDLGGRRMCRGRPHRFRHTQSMVARLTAAPKQVTTSTPPREIGGSYARGSVWLSRRRKGVSDITIAFADWMLWF